MNDIVKRLRIKANVISMGEKIAWGSDTDLMNEAADIIEALEIAIKKVSDYKLRLETQIQRMKNCQNCHNRYLGNQIDGYSCKKGYLLKLCADWQLKQSGDEG